MDFGAAPIYRALTQPILIAGVPRELAILNATFNAAVVFGMHSILGVPLFFIVHLGALALAKRDPQFFQTFRRHMWIKGYYGV
jgi:type IV secretory pathway TrbD component